MSSLFLKMTKIFENKREKEFDKSTIAMYVQNTNGEYTLSNGNTFPTDGYELNLEKSSCTNDGVLSQNSETKKINVKIANKDTCTLYFDKENKSLKTLNHLGLKSNGIKTNFDDPATTDEGIFEMEDDYGTSYYYRGAIENNYVKFADFYWRIIRLNGDGSLRIIYDGTSAHTNGENSTDRFTHTGQRYNTNYNDNKYVGWMYGPAGTTASTSKAQAQTNTVDSDIKKVVDEWYKINIEDKGYSSAVSDTLFCNDRSTPGSTATGWSYDTGLGYGANDTAYGTVARSGWSELAVDDNIKPQFTCPQKNDAFTVSDKSKGNGALTYPVGLITADEIVAAGSGKYGTANSSYYLCNPSKFYWTLSPYYFSETGANVFMVLTDGSLSTSKVSNWSSAVAPVINLSADYVATLSGTGTMSDPYTA